MGVDIFSLKKIPDLTLAQYSAEESGGVDDVIHQHNLFYRQLNRKGILFSEVYHLIYIYNPSANPGNRINIYFRADSNEQPVCMDEFMHASPISTYFKFEKTNFAESHVDSPVFLYRASLVKQDGMVMSSFPDKNTSFYTVNNWKTNEKARLIGLFRMMQRLNRPVAYVATIKAVDLSDSMRESFRTQIQYIRNMEKANIGNRDENAEQCLRVYDKFLENLRTTPHFICRISAFANNESLAKMILDSAASEAVEEGNYRIVCEKGQFQPLVPELTMSEFCLGETPRGMRTWNSIFMLKEVAAFGMFPVLYPGETIEIPKESAPIYEKTGLYLGKDNSGYDVYFPLKFLSKHALLAGVPGSGKTYSMLHLSSQLAGPEHEIPILILEPAKKEYRALAHNKQLKELMIFSPGSTGSFPLRINPFEFPIGYKVSEHMTNLYQVFEGSMNLEPPLPSLLQDGIEEVYRDHGWYSFEVNNGSHTYPTLQELYDKVEQILESRKYEETIKNNLISCLQTRIGGLLKRELGNVFNVSGSTMTPEEWLGISCVIELEALGKYASNFLTLLLLTIIRENLKQNPKNSKDKPRHVIFLEEAHNLIGPTVDSGSDKPDPKISATEYIVNMLAEVRALGEAIVIADQLPTSLASQVTKNTSLKIGLRITAVDDREFLGSTMSADSIQLEKMGSFEPGQALCIYENVKKPFEIRVHPYSDTSEAPNNEELLDLLVDRNIYQNVMEKDYSIFLDKMRMKKKPIYSMLDDIKRKKLFMYEKQKEIENRGYDLDTTEKMLDNYGVYRTQLVRSEKKIVGLWLEIILELNDYCKMNTCKQDSVISIISDEIRQLIQNIKDITEEAPEECAEILKVTLERISSEVAWIL